MQLVGMPTGNCSLNENLIFEGNDNVRLTRNHIIDAFVVEDDDVVAAAGSSRAVSRVYNNNNFFNLKLLFI